ncbi:MAG: ATP-binding protein [Gammaproteobacteria bacterium]|nr:ATP-binding protein [Gammaproteobacteria bacterium]
MSTTMVDVMLHIDETTSHQDREALRDDIWQLNGVMAASFHDEKPHLLIVEYNPDEINSTALLESVKSKGLNAELVGL